jgi:hypothetical protein
VVKAVQAASEEESEEDEEEDEESDEEDGEAFGRTKNGQPCRTCLTLKKRCRLHPNK